MYTTQFGNAAIVTTLISKLRQCPPVGLRMVVAGGFVRDSLLGRSPKDIDVFVEDSGVDASYSVYGHSSAVDELVSAHPLGGNVQRIDGYMSDNLDDAVTQVWNIGTFVGYNVQLIGIKHNANKSFISNVFDHIDFGICRVAHDGIQLHVSDEFTKDASSHTFTLCSPHTVNRSVDRYYRLTDEKYQGWTYVGPEPHVNV